VVKAAFPIELRGQAALSKKSMDPLGEFGGPRRVVPNLAGAGGKATVVVDHLRIRAALHCEGGRLPILVWLMLFVRRRVTTADLALLIVAIGMARALWILLGSGPWWLLDDRIVPASDVLLHWREEPAQLENFKEGAVRLFGLVRYSAICPICAAKVELRYGEGNERRRLFGGCGEAPKTIFLPRPCDAQGHLREVSISVD